MLKIFSIILISLFSIFITIFSFMYLGVSMEKILYENNLNLINQTKNIIIKYILSISLLWAFIIFIIKILLQYI